MSKARQEAWDSLWEKKKLYITEIGCITIAAPVVYGGRSEAVTPSRRGLKRLIEADCPSRRNNVTQLPLREGD